MDFQLIIRNNLIKYYSRFMELIYEKYSKLPYYIEKITTYITSKLLIHSMILFGGIVIDDFSKKYSDIDIVIV